MVSLAADMAAVGLGVIDAAILASLGGRTAMVGEPEPALLVEHQIVGTMQGPALALRIERAQGAGLQIKPLDHAAGMARRRGPRDSHTLVVQPLERAAIVGDVDRPVRADGRAIGPAPGFDDDLFRAVRAHAGEGLPLDLGQDHRAVVHGDGAFRKLEAGRQQLQIHRFSSPHNFPLLWQALTT